MKNCDLCDWDDKDQQGKVYILIKVNINNYVDYIYMMFMYTRRWKHMAMLSSFLIL